MMSEKFGKLKEATRGCIEQLGTVGSTKHTHGKIAPSGARAGRKSVFMEDIMANKNPVPVNAPSKNPGQPSGGGRGNNPPKGK